jgi:hypothetical protein
LAVSATVGSNGVPLTYEWFSYPAGSTTVTSVGTGRVFTPITTAASETYYYAVIKNGSTNPLYNTVTSDTVLVKIGITTTAIAPICSAAAGVNSATLSANTTGGSGTSSNYRYLWFKSTDDIVDAGDAVQNGGVFTSTASLTVVRPTTATTNYYYVVVKDNSCAAAAPFTSTAVSLTPLPTATISASAFSVVEGSALPIIKFKGAVAPMPYTFSYTLATAGAASGNGFASFSVQTVAADSAEVEAPAAYGN